jgi:membrane-bound serine protease (ClpP class)
MRYWLIILTFCSALSALNAQAQTRCTAEVDVTDTIGPATLDLLQRAEGFAERENCSSILLLINTPGGSLDSTRKIVEMILNSKYPYLCLVSPSGGHAGSAGAIILQACHVNGGVQGTNLGAATPVTMGGEMPEDIRKKVMNDTRSWLESLTKLRGRSEKFGQDIILDAKAVTAEEAHRLKAIDFVGPGKLEFLKFAGNRKVKMAGGLEAKVEAGDTKTFVHDTRYKALALLTDPQLAYMILLGSLGLLYFEITHPGTMIAGVVGSIGLVVALVALHKLEVEWGGLALILLGVAMLIAEMFVPAFGILGIGGIAAFIFGSIFLFDPVKTGGYQLPLTLILPVALFMAAVFLGVGLLFLKTRKVQKKGGFEDLLGLKARVVRVENNAGLAGAVELRGEIWSFQSKVPLNVSDEVFVNGYSGLILKVDKESKT